MQQKRYFREQQAFLARATGYATLGNAGRNVTLVKRQQRPRLLVDFIYHLQHKTVISVTIISTVITKIFFFVVFTFEKSNTTHFEQRKNIRHDIIG
jgi:hypothetical protein